MKTRVGYKLFAVASVGLALTIMKLDVFPISADGTSRFNELQKATNGFENRAESAGIQDAEKASETLPSNKDSIEKIMSVDKMTNYTKDEDLKDGAKYLSKKCMTYEQFINQYTEFDLNPTISKDRMVWVIQTHFPNGLVTDNGIVDDALSTVFYDAETGESIGWSVESLDPNFKPSQNSPFNHGIKR